jgi:two-component system, NarL family, sensor histidine kinase DesK
VVLGWGLREAVANLLRHSHAERCDITLTVDGDVARLVVVNDGADQEAAPPGGLHGLSERARQHGGTVIHGRVGDGRFRLEITIPVRSR